MHLLGFTLVMGAALVGNFSLLGWLRTPGAAREVARSPLGAAGSLTLWIALAVTACAFILLESRPPLSVRIAGLVSILLWRVLLLELAHYVEVPHHPCGVVLEDVAVIHPATGSAIGHPGDAGRALGR